MEKTEKKELDTKIDSVIVYQSGGVQITQIGSINLTSGEQLILMSNLPESLDKESVRVKGIGNGKIINIIVEYNSRKEYKTEEHKSLQEEKERIEREVKKNGDELFRLNEQIVKYKSLEDSFYSDWAKAHAFGEVELSKFVDFNEKINERIKLKSDIVDSIEDYIKELKKEQQVINNKISNLGPIEEVHNFYEIILNLNVLKDGNFKIEVRYTLTNSWWIPFYDVALSEENTARLTMMANIYNRTGLDWDDVGVEISTASLKPIRLVKPNPMILQEYYPSYGKKIGGKGYGGLPPRPPSRRSEIMSRDLISADESLLYDSEIDEMDGFMESKPQIEESYAEVSENIGVQSFKIPNRLDISSDKNPSPVNLTVIELETEKKYYWSSAAPENVIIIDILVNKDLLLLSGNVKIYFMEEFLGETSIQVVAPKEKFKLGTRVSYDLKIDK